MYLLERNVPRCRIYWLNGEKFKTNLLVLFFDLPLKRENATKTALLAEVLKQGCKEYPTPRALAMAAEEMYGALWDVSIVKKGERQLLLFSLEAAKAVSTETAMAFLQNLVGNPLTVGDAFPEEAVERGKKILREKITALKDDKREYARRRCLEETAKDTPLQISADGYIEDLEKISGKELFAYYEIIRESAMVKVFFCGDEGEKGRLTAFRRLFVGGEPVGGAEGETAIGKEPAYIREEMDMEQARLLLSFDSKAEWGRRSYGTLLVLNQLLGADPDSLLFQNLREKEGLCYDVKSFCYPMTGLLFVQTGIQGKDAKKAATEVLKAIEQLAEEPIPVKKLEQAKTALLRQYQTMEDLPWSMVDFSVEQVLTDGARGLDCFLRHIESVDGADICRMANRMKLSTIYLLGKKEGKDHENRK